MVMPTGETQLKAFILAETLAAWRGVAWCGVGCDAGRRRAWRGVARGGTCGVGWRGVTWVARRGPEEAGDPQRDGAAGVVGRRAWGQGVRAVRDQPLRQRRGEDVRRGRHL